MVIDNNRHLRQWATVALTRLDEVENALAKVVEDDFFEAETAIEVWTAMEIAVEGLRETKRCLRKALCDGKATAIQGAPTHQQGQFLAYIREYQMRNQRGIAPAHTDFQRFFKLTPPSVNSMLKRLEDKGFIRRIAGKARAIELTIDAHLIPALDQPFKFL